MRFYKKIVGISILGFFLFLFATTYAFAEIKLVPAHPDPRDRETFTFVKINLLNNKEYEEDFYLVNTEEKDYEVLLKPSQKKGIEIKLEKEKITVPAGKRILSNFRLKLFDNVPDGEYILYISAYNKDEEKFISKLPIKLLVGKKRLSKLEVKEAKLDITKKGIIINGRAKNTGNTIIDSLGFNLKLSNKTPILSLLGNSFEYYWTNPVNLTPDKEMQFKEVLPVSLPLGSYKGELDVIFSQDKPAIKKSFEAKNLTINFASLISFLKLGALMAALSFLVLKGFRFANKFKFKMPSLKMPSLTNKISLNTASTSKDSNKVEGLIERVFTEERHLADVHNISYDRLLFEIRKIVREEIELWKEMENFKKKLRERLEKEQEELLKEKLREMIK